MSIGIRAVGSYMPNDVRTITSPEGHDVNVRVAGKEELLYYMAGHSLKDMAARAGIEISDLEHQFLHINQESYGDYLFMLHGRHTANEVGLDRITSFNLHQGSNSSLLLMRLMLAHLRANEEKRFAVIGAPMSWEYHSVNRLLGDAVLGDGSAMLLLEKGYERNRILSVATKTIGKYNDILYNEVGGWVTPIAEEPCREGKFVYKVHNTEHYEEVKSTTLDVLEPVIQEALAKAGVKWEQIAKFVIHSATPTLHQRFLERFKLSEEQVIDSAAHYGYMCSTGLLLSFETLVHETDLETGSYALAAAFGIDGNWAASVIEI